jgi:hypothetical protein
MKYLLYSFVATLSALASCSSAVSSYNVSSLLSSDANGISIVSVSGILQYSKGSLNLYSRSGNVCVGILASENELQQFRAFSRKSVTVTGTYDPQGCGENGICDHNLCGPGTMSAPLKIIRR